MASSTDLLHDLFDFIKGCGLTINWVDKQETLFEFDPVFPKNENHYKLHSTVRVFSNNGDIHFEIIAFSLEKIADVETLISIMKMALLGEGIKDPILRYKIDPEDEKKVFLTGIILENTSSIIMDFTRIHVAILNWIKHFPCAVDKALGNKS